MGNQQFDEFKETTDQQPLAKTEDWFWLLLLAILAFPAGIFILPYLFDPPGGVKVTVVRDTASSKITVTNASGREVKVVHEVSPSAPVIQTTVGDVKSLDEQLEEIGRELDKIK